MNSRITKIGRKLIVLTLIAGFLLMPVAPILAEETLVLAPVETAPVAVDISSDLVVDSDPVIETSVSTPIESGVATDTCPVVIDAPAIIEATSTDPLPLVEELALVYPVDQPEPKALDPDIIGEDSFTTSSELPVDIGDLTASDELNFTTITGEIDIPDNMTISDENPFGDDVVIIDPSVSVEGQWETLPEEETDNMAISAEGNFTTTSVPDEEDAVSGENSFTTAIPPVEDDLTVSAEQSFYTLDVPSDDLAISAEHSFVTLSIPTDEITVSDEGSFVTLKGDDEPVDPSVSTEQSFTTLGAPENPTVSEEMSFTTLSPVENPTVSEEMSFTTLGGSGDPDGEENSFTTLGNSGCTSNCGGGGGGGGGGHVLAEKTYRCEILLYKFIRLGQANDRREVIKLQAFLKVYEGFNNLKLTGIYDAPTYRAVEIFQKRYSKDILGPWKISDSTGYVYITTRIAINNIFCGRDTTNNMDLRDEFYRQYQMATGETYIPGGTIDSVSTSTDPGYYITSTTEATSSPVVKKSWILASLSGLFGFVGDNLCWLLNLLLLLIILFLLWLLWLGNRDDNDDFSATRLSEDNSVDLMGLPANKIEETNVFEDPIVNSSLGIVGAVALEELMTEDDQIALADLAEEEDSQMPAANNDPDQETFLSK